MASAATQQLPLPKIPDFERPPGCAPDTPASKKPQHTDGGNIGRTFPQCKEIRLISLDFGYR